MRDQRNVRENGGSVHTGDPRDIKKRLEFLGHSIFYLVLRLFGQAGAYGLLIPVIFTYILFGRKIHRQTRPYLERRFPEHTRQQRWVDTFRNVLSFGRILVDRGWLGCVRDASLSHKVVNREKLDAIIAAGKGAILLTAHVGNWQTAFSNLRFLKVPVHALMQYDPQAAARHYFDLGKKERSFAIINADGPFGGMIEATAALQRGEFVTIMGDRFIKGPSSTVLFLGKKVRLPNAAYTLAAHVGVPVVVFLAAKTGRKSFQLQVWDIFDPRFESRESHQDMLTECSRKFAEALEKYLKIFPYQWYNFFDFWTQ
jgi:predicted LPLAT superfamily acyltransferase